MKRLLGSITLVLVSAACVYGQDPSSATSSADRVRLNNDLPSVASPSLGGLAPTQEMWFYEQALRRYNNPKVAVRQRAEFDAQQRDRRLATSRWFGVSKSRPTVNPTPVMSEYGQRWISNTGHPYNWSATSGSPTTIVLPSSTAVGLW